MRTDNLSTTRGSAVALLLGLSLFALAGCATYEPYPAAPVYGGYYYSPPPAYYYSAPSYYYYRPCCASYFNFTYTHRDRGYDRGYRHRDYRGWR